MNIKGRSTLGNYKNILNLRGYSDNTIEIYCHYVNEFIMTFNKPALHLTIKDLETYILNYNYTSKSKQNQIYSSVKLFYKYILKIELSNKILLKRPKKETKLPNIISEEYLLECLNNIKNIKHKSVLTLAYSVGLRRSEIINLKILDIDSKNNQINIKQGKGKKDRNVPLREKVLLLLREYYIQYKPKEYLFNGQNLLQYSPTSLNSLVKKYIGKEYSFHNLRHSIAVHLINRGIDISFIQKLLGHNDIKTTMIYLNISTQDLNKLNFPI